MDFSSGKGAVVDTNIVNRTIKVFIISSQTSSKFKIPLNSMHSVIDNSNYFPIQIMTDS
ncbi:hypothetical protein THIOM_000816 [Candidatus Thiomargarita nelsonii]|uniref:Uncharacterized protein n=1 Tax=Candidatus Thiomargarita nelsonii TaxID=1003181 RepID=A0A176S5R5_9GAMM|nr:hypothetical protein THIOM_000816 [Candidatus Thiomargarita nelsonii]